METPYGIVRLTGGRLGRQWAWFVPRHGGDHSLPPHRINYRANIDALRQLGVQGILATSAVGSLRPDLPAGSLVLLDQFIDFTKGRTSTFFDQPGQVVHTDFTEPYCPWMRRQVAEAAGAVGIPVIPAGCYVCAEGPRYETPAEIRAFRLLGGDVVGMTGVPEVVLAREAGICYAGIALVTNLGAGLSGARLSHEEVAREMARNIDRLQRLAAAAIEAIGQGWERRDCACSGKGRAAG